ncbi:MAG: hypothetical protein PUP91_20655 [Rhizonema sp. PD37]|nr:hypothetical protein [Rhizonema sp. PD37]
MPEGAASPDASSEIQQEQILLIQKQQHYLQRVLRLREGELNWM